MNKFDEFIVKYKKTIIAVLVVVLSLVVVGDLIFTDSNNGAEKAAVQFTEAMLDANAKKCANLMCDDLIEMSNYETKKIFVNALEKQLETAKDEYIDTYGKRWKYKISVVDSLEYEPFYGSDEELIKVVLKVEHKGSGLFNEKDGEEEIELIMVERNGKWLVYDL